LNIARTTLSLHGSGFMEALKNKYELSYNQPYGSVSTPMEQGGQEKKGFVKRIFGG